MIVLDTNILSELMKPKPALTVIDWIALQPIPSLFTTTITEAEIRYGIDLMAAGRLRQELSAAADGMFREDLAGRVLPFDSAAALDFATIASTRRAAGRPIAQFDAQVAAIARSRGAAVATRNVGDFIGCGIDVINPWQL